MYDDDAYATNTDANTNTNAVWLSQVTFFMNSVLITTAQVPTSTV